MVDVRGRSGIGSRQPALALVFPGEGSVEAGCGQPWRDHPSWAAVERLADQVDVDLPHLLLDASPEALRRVDHAQQAALGLGVLVWDALARSGLSPAVCLGHGVGEYVALAAGGALDRDALATVVAARAAGMSEAVAARAGRTTQIVGLYDDDVHGLCAMAGREVWLAQHNAVRQVAVAGDPEAVATVEGWAHDAGAELVGEVAVDAALHCPLLEPATPRLRQALEEVAWRPPTCPVVSGLLARPYPGRFEPERVLLAHLVSPLRWRHALTNAVRLGASVFVHLGRTRPTTPSATDMTPLPTVDVAHPDDLEILDLVVQHARRSTWLEAAGELLSVPERLVVSPAAGRFVASDPIFSDAGVGAEVRVGQRFGRVGEADVRSLFSGRLMGLLARPGERVTVGQPIAWIRT